MPEAGKRIPENFPIFTVRLRTNNTERMLYYRRKLLLAVLETFGGRLSAIQLQKYLFLITRRQADKSFHFVPFKYGCFSFQANQDMTTLGTYGYIHITDNGYTLNDAPGSYASQLNLFDRQAVREVHDKFGAMSQDELVACIYRKYPYYAINSSIAAQLLTGEELEKVNGQRRKKTERQLFTIGYEGVSLEQYINKLIIEDVHVLCDVRKNAYSQKYGFSKSQLEKACRGTGIRYVHIPALGIASDKRKTLSSQRDYDVLFEEYERTVLATQREALAYIRNLIRSDRRVALTCFEKDPGQCHRTRVANALMETAGEEYSLCQIIF